MPASATRQRPPVPPQRQDGLRRDAANEEGGEAFRAAIDDVDSKRMETRKSHGERLDARRADKRQRAESKRQDSDAHAAGDKAAVSSASRDEAAPARANDATAKGSADASSNSNDQGSTASRGGFGSDPSASASAGAGGSAGPNVGTPPAIPLATAGHAGQPSGGGRQARPGSGGRALGEDLRVAASTPWGTDVPGNTGSQDLRGGGQLPTGPNLRAMADSMSEGDAAPIVIAGGPDAPLVEEQGGATAQQLAALDALDVLNSQGSRPSAGLDAGARGGEQSLSGTTPLTGQAVNSATSASAITAHSSLSAFRGAGPQTTAAGEAGPANPMVEPEPMPGSVHLSGIRGARVVVPLEDGEMIRARVDVTDDQVDVRLVSSGDGALMAERRESDLRDGLAQKGLQLGEFEVATSEDGDSRASDQFESEQDRRDARVGSRRIDSSIHRSTSPELSTDASTSQVSDDGNGNLLNLRL